MIGIYLAAGKSRRMGKNKLSLTADGTSLGSIALQTALQSTLSKIYVIVKETDDLIWIPSEVKSNIKCIILKCNTAGLGQAESIKCGIRQAQVDQAQAAMILLADQPFITVELIETIIAHIKRTPTNKFVASSYKQIIMPPVLFSDSMYERLLDLHGDMGAKKLLYNSLLNDGELILNADKRLFFDVDVIEDYQKFILLQDAKSK